MNEENYQMIAFTEDGLSLDVRVDTEKDTVWLTQAEMASLFDVDRTRITRHVNNILSDDEVDAASNVRKTHFANADRPTALYGLDMILAVGYRVNSKRGIAFRRWANTVLKQYLVEGYAKNEKRLAALHRTLEVQRALLTHYAEGAGVDADEVMPRVMCGKRTLQTPIVRRLFCALTNGRPISKKYQLMNWPRDLIVE